ncbi:MAG: protein kinase domain-containing protein, partial [Gemmatimonadaceae bacterium]
MDDLSGTVVGERYLIERSIGRGGMATVWLASDAQHERMVAIKTLHPDLAGAIGVDRFLRELHLTARVQHPWTVPILDSGVLDTPDGRRVPWYAMPYLQGESLRARLSREYQLSIEESLRITEALGKALEAAHREQIVHRDIKPENVLLSGEHVYVLDFGIARAARTTGEQRLTGTGLAIGTPAYMSPEQSVGEAVDARSDQYSLATVLYEMIAGEPPFTGVTTQVIFARRLSEKARPLTAVRSTIPEPVERATLRALERTPADRFQSIAAFLAALRGHAPPPPVRVPRRQRFPTAAVVAGLIAVAALVGWWLMSRDRPAREHVVDPEVIALYQRAVQAHDRRTATGVAEAIATLRVVLARDSAYAAAWNALAKAYTRAHGRAFSIPGTPTERLLPLAVAAVDRSLSLDSASADAWATHALVSREVDPVDLAPALRSVRHSLALDSMQPRALNTLALYTAESGDLATALEIWRRAVRFGPGYAETIAFFALGHYWRGNFDSAAVWADSALRIDPNFLLAREASGVIAVERGDFPRADAAFEAARRLSTDIEIVNAMAGVALAMARSGRRGEATAIVRRAESLASEYDPIPLHTAVDIAKASAALGDADRTIRMLRRYQPAQSTHFQLPLRCDAP